MSYQPSERVAMLADSWRHKAYELRDDANSLTDVTPAVSGIVMQAEANVLEACAKELDELNEG